MQGRCRLSAGSSSTPKIAKKFSKSATRKLESASPTVVRIRMKREVRVTLAMSANKVRVEALTAAATADVSAKTNTIGRAGDNGSGASNKAKAKRMENPRQ